jgi:glycerophosphocholine phosphodiesterase GPCPD1
LSGSTAKLGLWVPDSAAELEPLPEDRNTWRLSVELSPEESRKMLGFRYFIGYNLQTSADPASRLRIVSRWEAARAPRCLLPSVEASGGVCRLKHIDEFGFYGGKENIADGWLIQKEHKEILLRIHGDALKFYKLRHAKREYFLKVTPFDLRHKEVGSVDDEPDDVAESSFLPALPSFSTTDLAILSRDNPHFHDQHPTGESFRNNEDYFVFRTQSVAVDYLAFRVEFFTDTNVKTSPIASGEKTSPIASGEKFNSENSARTTSDSTSIKTDSSSSISTKSPKIERTAIAYCMPSSMAGTFGSSSVPILAKTQQPIGQLKLDYLFIRALERRSSVNSLTLESTFIRHWRKRRTLEVGHRGAGNSYTKFAAARENTIHSLMHAADKGADFVEFDVQLTKDKTAIVFHDFHVLVSVAKRSSSLLDLSGITSNSSSSEAHSPGGNSQMIDFHELAVKDLKLTQLQLLHLEHYKATEADNKDKLRVTGSPNESPDLRPFPTLADALKLVNQDTGFNVEVKYPMMMQDGSHECENYFERNEFIDVILNDVLEHGGARRILFSSFDPDICTLIALKQNKYPVLFLCVGESTRYVPFLDKRSGTSLTAVNFAASTRILGVNFHSEDLLRNALPVQRANHFGLVSFVWGDDLDNPQHIDYFRKQLLVDGIVYDRIGEIEARKNVFTVEREAKNALFNRSTSPSVSRSCSIDKTASVLANALLLNDAMPSKGSSSRENSSSSPTRSYSQRRSRDTGKTSDASSPKTVISPQSPPSPSSQE